MRKNTEVGVSGSAISDITKDIINDNTAWADLILSKTALILASVVILAAVYNLAAVSSDLVKKDELEVITLDLASNIDSVGSARPDASDAVKNYCFENSARQLVSDGGLNISVSGEYVSSIFEDEGHNVSSVRSLSYRTLPFSPGNLRSMLTDKFAADGSINRPVYSIFPYTDVTDFLAIASAEERYLNISEEVHIEKTSVFVTDGNEVNELEYVLVYQ